MTSLYVYKACDSKRIFSINPTMAEETAEESNRAEESKRLLAQRDNTKQEQHKNRVAAIRESIKRNCAEESQEQRKNRLAAQRDNAKRKRAEESQEQ